MDINFCHLLSYDSGDSFVHWCHCFGVGADDASGVGGAVAAVAVAASAAVADAVTHRLNSQ